MGSDSDTYMAHPRHVMQPHGLEGLGTTSTTATQDFYAGLRFRVEGLGYRAYPDPRSFYLGLGGGVVGIAGVLIRFREVITNTTN